MAAELSLVREARIPISDLKPGDTLILPGGRRVTVDEIADYNDGLLTVRWWRPADRGEPGHPGGKDRFEEINGCWDGRYLGSLAPAPPDHHVTIET